MADEQNNQNTQWIVLLCIVVVVFILFSVNKKMIQPLLPHSNHPVVPVETKALTSNPTSSVVTANPSVAIQQNPTVVSPEMNSNVSVAANPSIENPAVNKNAPATVAAAMTNTPATSSGESSAPSQQGLAASSSNQQGAIANPMPTQQQAEAASVRQNAQQQALDKTLADRQKQIAEVHQSIVESGGGNYSQPKVFVAPILTPPDDVAQKLKSHQMVGH